MSTETVVTPTPALLATLIPAPRQAEPLPPYVQQQIDKAFRLEEKTARHAHPIDTEVPKCWQLLSQQREQQDHLQQVVEYINQVEVLTPSAPAPQPSAPVRKSLAERLDYIAQRKGRAARKRRLLSLSA